MRCIGMQRGVTLKTLIQAYVDLLCDIIWHLSMGSCPFVGTRGDDFRMAVAYQYADLVKQGDPFMRILRCGSDSVVVVACCHLPVL